jgi:hypothetical protein
MCATNGAGVTHRVGDADARRIDQLGGKVSSLATLENEFSQDYTVRTAVHAELSGSNTANAWGFTVQGFAPVLKLCRRLLAAGVDPRLPLHAYRGDTPEDSHDRRRCASDGR